MERDKVLDAVKSLICGDRDVQYGSPATNFAVSADLWKAYCRQRFGPTINFEASDVASMMALFKIARIAADSGKEDSWLDAIGYLACGAEVAGEY
jgi:hypothetical protein